LQTNIIANSTLVVGNLLKSNEKGILRHRYGLCSSEDDNNDLIPES
jgi:hypothetical protein